MTETTTTLIQKIKITNEERKTMEKAEKFLCDLCNIINEDTCAWEIVDENDEPINLYNKYDFLGALENYIDYIREYI